MARGITQLYVGKEVRYMDHTYEVEKVYPYIAYLRSITTGEVICVGVGDLVMAGVEPSLPLGKPILYSEAAG